MCSPGVPLLEIASDSGGHRAEFIEQPRGASLARALLQGVLTIRSKLLCSWADVAPVADMHVVLHMSLRVQDSSVCWLVAGQICFVWHPIWGVVITRRSEEMERLKVPFGHDVEYRYSLAAHFLDCPLRVAAVNFDSALTGV